MTSYVVVAACVLLVGGERWMSGKAGASKHDGLQAARVAEVAGFTKVATTNHYVVIVNVLPAERMFTTDEVASEHPLEGELVLRGPANPVVASARHVEAHVYDRVTGLPMTTVTPSIRLSDLASGAVIDVEPTMMQDVIIGAPDVHFGNNVVVDGDRDIRVAVDVGGEGVVISGHLD